MNDRTERIETIVRITCGDEVMETRFHLAVHPGDVIDHAAVFRCINRELGRVCGLYHGCLSAVWARVLWQCVPARGGDDETV